MKPLWSEYQLTMSFIHRVCGSVPADPEIQKIWLESRKPKALPPGGRSIDEVQEEVFRTIALEEEERESLLVFQRVTSTEFNREADVPPFLAVRAGTIRAHIKDCARVISGQYIGKIKGERSFAVKVLNGVYVDERQYWIPLLDQDGIPLSAATGRYDKPVHAKGPSGQPINAIKTIEFCIRPKLEVKLKVLGDSVKEQDLRTLFEFGGIKGYGGERGDNEGKYVFELKRLGEKE